MHLGVNTLYTHSIDLYFENMNFYQICCTLIITIYDFCVNTLKIFTNAANLAYFWRLVNVLLYSTV